LASVGRGNNIKQVYNIFDDCEQCGQHNTVITWFSWRLIHIFEIVQSTYWQVWQFSRPFTFTAKILTFHFKGINCPFASSVSINLKLHQLNVTDWIYLLLTECEDKGYNLASSWCEVGGGSFPCMGQFLIHAIMFFKKLH
jgi:hypothetical protein